MQRGEVWWVEFDPAGNHRQQQRCQPQSVPRHRRAIDQQHSVGSVRLPSSMPLLAHPAYGESCIIGAELVLINE